MDLGLATAVNLMIARCQIVPGNGGIKYAYLSTTDSLVAGADRFCWPASIKTSLSHFYGPRTLNVTGGICPPRE